MYNYNITSRSVLWIEPFFCAPRIVSSLRLIWSMVEVRFSWFLQGSVFQEKSNSTVMKYPRLENKTVLLFNLKVTEHSFVFNSERSKLVRVYQNFCWPLRVKADYKVNNELFLLVC